MMQAFLLIACLNSRFLPALRAVFRFEEITTLISSRIGLTLERLQFILVHRQVKRSHSVHWHLDVLPELRIDLYIGGHPLILNTIPQRIIFYQRILNRLMQSINSTWYRKLLAAIEIIRLLILRTLLVQIMKNTLLLLIFGLAVILRREIKIFQLTILIR